MAYGGGVGGGNVAEALGWLEVSFPAELAQGKGFVEGADAVQDEQVGTGAAVEVGVEFGSGEGEGAAVPINTWPALLRPGRSEI